MSGPSEAGFEDAICNSLVGAGGYLDPAKVGLAHDALQDLDPSSGIDTAELFAFIGSTQGEEWGKIRKSHSSPDEATPRHHNNRLKRNNSSNPVSR